MLLQQTADVVFFNGNFLTMDVKLPRAEAVAIKDGRILWVGKTEDAKPFIDSRTEMIDLQGAYVYPGFIDSHAHVFYMSHFRKRQLNVSDCKDKESILQKVSRALKGTKADEWLIGMGWDEGLWQDPKLPTKEDLDAISTEQPIFLRRIDTHSAWVNSKALALAGITASTPDPEGGKIYRDSRNNPTGILVDKGVKLLYPYMPEHSLEETVDLVKEALQECVKKGITTIHNAATADTEFAAYEMLAKKNALPIRIYAMALMPSSLGEAFLESGPQVFSPFFEVRCIKIFIDGAMGSRGASLFEPYSDDKETSGLLIWKQEELLPIIKQARKKGFQVAAHAIGDRAAHLVLNAYETCQPKGQRFRVEHAQQLARSDIPRFKELEVIAAMQPLHLACDMGWLEARLGKKRTKEGSFLIRSLLEAGVIVSGGSDAPVVEVNPLWGIYAATTRQDLSGTPFGGWHPEECVSRMQALEMYTMGGAIAGFREHELGSISVGKLADLVVFGTDLLSCDPRELLKLEVLYTIVDGKIAYKV